MTNLDQTGRERLEPRPVRGRLSIRRRGARSAGPTASTDPSWVWTATATKASTRRRIRRPTRCWPRRSAGPTRRRLAAAPPRRCGCARRRTRRAGADEPDDPWRDPGAAAALGTPAVPQPPRAPSNASMGKLGVRDVLFGGRVSYVALAVLGIVALVIGFAGGWVGRKTAEVVEAFTTSKVTLETSDNGAAAARAGSPKSLRQWLIRWSPSRRSATRRARRAPASSSTAAATSSPTTTSSPRPPTNPSQYKMHGGVQRRQGGARQPRRPRPEDRPRRAEGRQRRQPDRRPDRRLRQAARSATR